MEIIGILAAVVTILAFLYVVIIGQKSIPEWWRERQRECEKIQRAGVEQLPLPPARPLFFSLPPVAKGFIGRTAELAELQAAFDDPNVNVLLIAGPAGRGKTFLAARLWEALDGQAERRWLTCREDTGLDELLSLGGGELMGDDPRKALVQDPTRRPEERMDALLRFLEERGPYALFLDDVHKVRGAGLDPWVKWMAQKARCTNLILTARRRPQVLDDPKLPPGTWRELPLEGLEKEEAREYLARHGLKVDEETAWRIWEKCGQGDPTAMQVFANACRTRPVEGLLGELPVWRLEAANKWLADLWGDLAPEEVELLEAVSVLRRPVTRAAVAAISGQADSDRWLDALQDRYLLTRAGGEEEAYTLNDIYREYAYEVRLTPEVRAERHRRAGEYELHQAGSATDERTGVDHRFEALYHFHKAGERARVLELAGEVVDRLDIWGLWERAAQVCTWALEAARAQGDRRAEAGWLNSLGIRHEQGGGLGKGPLALRRSPVSLPQARRPPRRGRDAEQPGQRLRRPGPLGRGHRVLRARLGYLPRPGRPPRRGHDPHEPGQRLADEAPPGLAGVPRVGGVAWRRQGDKGIRRQGAISFPCLPLSLSPCPRLRPIRTCYEEVDYDRHDLS